jgi:hypothetical protein
MTNRLRMTLIKKEIPQPAKTNQRHLKLKRPKKKLKRRRKREMTMVMKTQVTITMVTTMERMITMAKTMIKRKKRRYD